LLDPHNEDVATVGMSLLLDPHDEDVTTVDTALPPGPHNEDVTTVDMARIAASLEKIEMLAVIRIFRTMSLPRHGKLHALLRMSRFWLATNPADKIYGLMSLVDPQDRIPPDYSKPYVQVYNEFVKRRLEIEPTLWLLQTASFNVPIPGLPSWCANFNLPATATGLLDLEKPKTNYCAGIQAENNERIHVITSIEAGRISIRGFYVDEVVEVIPPSWPRQEGRAVHKWERTTANQALNWELSCLKLSRETCGLLDEGETHCQKHIGGQLLGTESPQKTDSVRGNT
jgi:hypothetical protein